MRFKEDLLMLKIPDAVPHYMYVLQTRKIPQESLVSADA